MLSPDVLICSGFQFNTTSSMLYQIISKHQQICLNSSWRVDFSKTETRREREQNSKSIAKYLTYKYSLIMFYTNTISNNQVTLNFTPLHLLPDTSSLVSKSTSNNPNTLCLGPPYNLLTSC